MERRAFSRRAVALGVALATGAQARQRAGGDGGIPRRTARTTRLFKSPGLLSQCVGRHDRRAGSDRLRILGHAEALVEPPQSRAALAATGRRRSRRRRGRRERCWQQDVGLPGLRQRLRRARQRRSPRFQVDLHSAQVSHRQIPLSLDGRGGGCHGVKWHDGKLWSPHCGSAASFASIRRPGCPRP